MTEHKDPFRHVSRRALLVGGAGLAVGLGAVYGIRTTGGKSGGGAACRNARAVAARAAPFARGEVAGFVPARAPISVSDLAFADESGTGLTLSRFAGKTILFNLWATWCAPCRHEMPALDRLQASHGGPRFQVVAVNIDTGGGAAPRKFLDDIGATNLAYYADETMGVFNELKRRGRAIGMPTTLLVDPQGCEVGTMAGPAEWDSDDAIALIDSVVGPG